MTDPAIPITRLPEKPRSNVRPLGRRGEGFVGDDAALVAALRRGDPGAPAALYDRHAPYLQRVLARVLGVDDELPEVLHETFAQVLGSIDGLGDPNRLKPWMVRVAVFTARGTIRRRQRRRWLRYGAPEQLPEPTVGPTPPEARMAVERLYGVLDRLSTKERLPFTLRYLEGMQLTEVADACGFSLSSAKRYLRRGETRFVTLAKRDPILRDYLARSPRFSEML